MHFPQIHILQFRALSTFTRYGWDSDRSLSRGRLFLSWIFNRVHVKWKTGKLRPWEIVQDDTHRMALELRRSLPRSRETHPTNPLTGEMPPSRRPCRPRRRRFHIPTVSISILSRFRHLLSNEMNNSIFSSETQVIASCILIILQMTPKEASVRCGFFFFSSETSRLSGVIKKDSPPAALTLFPFSFYLTFYLKPTSSVILLRFSPNVSLTCLENFFKDI